MANRIQSASVRGLLTTAAALGVLACASTASAVSQSYSFSGGNITNNNAVNAGTGGQYTVTVSASSSDSGVVYFKFANAGPSASSITDIYFYDGALLGATLNSFTSSAGVSFSQGAAPPALPGGNGAGLPNSTVAFSADSNSPTQPNGVQPTEYVEIMFTLQGSNTYADVIASIAGGVNGPFETGEDLVFGIHVQGFSNGGSESFVLVPLPAPVYMGLAGLAGVILMRRRKLM